jgi:aldehyde:ferredoxin oxidoreductase
MNLIAKKVLLINLTDHEYDVKTYDELYKFIGGVGIGLKLYQILYEKNPIIFSVGPLNGFFPFSSKTSVILNEGGVIEDMYLGGNLATRLACCGIDSLVLYGRSKERIILDITNTNVRFVEGAESINSLGLPGKRSIIKFFNHKLLLSDFFTTSENFLETALINANVAGLVVTGTETFEVPTFDKYADLYKKILSKKEDLVVNPDSFPSCSNCPMGCNRSQVGEIGGNVLVHSLVACQYADAIYSDMGIVFSCLSSLGYRYTHEDLENLPTLIEDVLKRIS